MRRHTYPPDFRYITRAELRSTMADLAQRVAELDGLMRAEGPIDAARRAEIARLLGELERSANALDEQGWRTNHPRIDQNLPAFVRDVRLAREGVEREPPSYYLAGSVAGACTYCHGLRN
jgi:hypothetical protein